MIEGCWKGYPAKCKMVTEVITILKVEATISGVVLMKQVSGNDKNCNWAIANLHSEVPIFCRVRNHRYWHTDLKQVKWYQDTHFEHHCSFLYPNQAYYPSRGDSRHCDAISMHCKRSPLCNDALKANSRTNWLSEDLQIFTSLTG